MNYTSTVKLENITKSFGDFIAVSRLTLSVRAGRIYGLLGRNGAGKTTTFRMIIGMIRPESGVVTFDGFDVTHLPMYKRARRGMGYLSQEHSIFRQLTVWQNLLIPNVPDAFVEKMKKNLVKMGFHHETTTISGGRFGTSHAPG